MELWACRVYGIRAVDQADYFYIGSTKKTVEERLKEHVSGLKWNKNLHFVRKVRKIGVERLVIEAVEFVTPENRFEREYAWIRDLTHRGVKLTNIVTDAHTYIASRRQDDHEERITERSFLIRGLAMMREGGKTLDPRNQRIHDELCRVGLLIFDSLEADVPGYFDPTISDEEASALLAAAG